MLGTLPGHMLSKAAERIVLFLRVSGPIFTGVKSFDAIIICFYCIIAFNVVVLVSNEQIMDASSFIL